MQNETSASPVQSTSVGRWLTRSEAAIPKHGLRAKRARLFALVLIASLAQFMTAQTTPPTYYVATNGNDSNPGTFTAPFRTIERAQREVRLINNDMVSDIAVYLRGGRYELSTTLTFSSQDSGTNGYNIIYASYPGEDAHVSGGRTISGWISIGNGIYKANAGGLKFRQLYVNGATAIRARDPNAGSLNTIQYVDGANKQIHVTSNEVQNYSRLNEVEFIFHQEWIQYISRIGSISFRGPTAIVTPLVQGSDRIFDFSNTVFGNWQTHYYYIENAYEVLDSPGEWYFNQGSGELFYLPRPGEDMWNALVTAPVLEHIVEFQGTLSSPVRNIRISGITFEDSTWMFPSEEVFGNLQADQIANSDGLIIPGGIHIQNAINLSFVRNVFHNMGGAGVMLYSGASNNTFIANVFKDICASGIIVDGAHDQNPTDSRSISRNNKIQNNYFTRTARYYRGSVGIFATYPEGLIVEHNEFTDLPYSAISVGWGWTAEDSPAKNNIIRYNRIHNVMNFLADGGGIYTLSKQPGTSIKENYIFNNHKSRWGGLNNVVGIYLDWESSHMRVENNIVEDTDWSYLLNLGYNNTLINVMNAEGYVYVGHNRNDSDAIINDLGLLHAESIKANAGIEPEYQDILVEKGPSSPPSISVSDTSMSVGSAVQVTVQNAPGIACDWIGLYRAGSSTLVYWVYLTGTRACTAKQSASFPWFIYEPDSFEFRLHDAFDLNGTFPLATSNTVTVTGPIASGANPDTSTNAVVLPSRTSAVSPNPR